MRLVRRRISIVLLLAACDGGARAEEVQAVRAEDFRSEELDRALEEASEVVRTRGFTLQGDPWRGFLVDRGTSVKEVSLRSGVCYAVVAVGSAALERIDVTVYDSDGAETARSGPQVSALRVCPPQSGIYFVAMRASGSGLFAARRFQGPAGLDIRLDDLAAEAP